MIMPGPREGLNMPATTDTQARALAGKVATDYCLTSLAAIKKFLAKTIGYELNIPDNATGNYGKHVFRNGNLVSELAAPAIYGDVTLSKVERDKDGHIRVTGVASNKNGQSRIFEAVLQEYRKTEENRQDAQSGQVQWRVLKARLDHE